MAQTPQPEHTQNGSETTRKINPRVEIDTSPPFGSVKEAVTLFGGSGSWIPLHVLRLAADQGVEEFNLDKVEKQAAELEKDLILKEQETLEVLKELEAAKRVVEGLKLSLMKEVSSFMDSLESSPDCQMSTPNQKPAANLDLSLCPVSSPNLILMELNEAKKNLNKTTSDLSGIRASVESLNKKMRQERNLLEKGTDKKMPNSVEEKYDGAKMKLQTTHDAEIKHVLENSMNVSRDLEQFNFEVEQYEKMEEAARYEVIKATSEIEQTKKSIKMVEMRLIAAKKMEEAARAMEAISLAERSSKVLQQNPKGITLSYEEYTLLTQKAQKADDQAKKKVVDANANWAPRRMNEASLSKNAVLNKFDEKMENVKRTKKSLQEALGKEDSANRMRYSVHNSPMFKYRNSHQPNGHMDSQPLDRDNKPGPVWRSTISIGDILSRKLVLQDDMVCHNERQEVSLSQMLREQSGLILNPPKAAKDESVDKQFLSQRKRFGFIHVSLPLTRQSKKKAQALNLR